MGGNFAFSVRITPDTGHHLGRDRDAAKGRHAQDRPCAEE